jgi:hypothetical protein
VRDWSSARRDLAYFLCGPTALAAAIMVLYAVWPWRVVSPIQALNYRWYVGATFLTLGALGVFLSSRIGMPSAPRWDDLQEWKRLALIGGGAGLAIAALDTGLGFWPSMRNHLEASARTAGFTWVNVGPPASLPHYAFGAIIAECFYRLGPIVIVTWLVSSLLLRGRFQGSVYWTVAAFTALLEPLEQAILSHGDSLTHMKPLEIALTTEGVGIELFESWLLRRFGWPAPIFYRLAYYAVAHVFGGYLHPYNSIFYPGPHA